MSHELFFPVKYIRSIGQVLIRVEYFTKLEGHRTLLAGVEDTVNFSYHLYYSIGSPPDPVPMTLNI